MELDPKRSLIFFRVVNSHHGMSLIENVVAMAVVFLALLGFAGFSMVAHMGISASEKMTRAVTLAQEKMEDVRREGVPSGLLSPVNTTEPYGTIVEALHHQRFLTIVPDNPIPGLHKVTVRVEWDNGAHTTSLKTYLTTK